MVQEPGLVLIFSPLDQSSRFFGPDVPTLPRVS